MSKSSERDRRVKGNGGVSKRKDGTWMSYITIGINVNGSPKRKYFYGKTEYEVTKKLREFMREKEKYTPENIGKVSIDDFLNDWLEGYLVHSLKPKSYGVKDYVINNLIVPSIGHYSASTITNLELQRFINELSKKYAPSTIKKVYDTLNQRYKSAIEQNMLAHNPCVGLMLPKINNSFLSKDKYFTVREVKLIINESSRVYCNSGTPIYRLGALIPFLLHTGLRIGEALALEWTDVDFKNRILYVNKNVVDVKCINKDGSSKWTVICQDNLKTSSSTRVIPLSDGAIESLEQVKKINGDKKLIFCSQNGKHLFHKNVDRMFRGMQKALGFKTILGVHALRHTFTTLLIDNKIDVKTVSEILGHSNVNITYQCYTHVMQEQKAKAINLINVV